MKTIRGYISSDGSVKDLLIKQTNREGYHQLVRDSVNKINELIQKSDDVDEIQALTELEASYRKTLNGEQAHRNWTREEGVQYLDYCIAVAYHVIRPSSKKPTKHRSEVTRWKSYWRKHLPIGNFIGSIKLSKDKFDSVMDGIDDSINWNYV